jgi:hypothetical protein
MKKPYGILLLRGIREYCIDILNLMGNGDVSQLTYVEICDLCKRYSRGDSRPGKGPRDMISRITKAPGGGITRVEIGQYS